MRAVFNDAVLEETFCREGFVTVPLLGAKEVDELNSVCGKMTHGLEATSFTHSHSMEVSKRKDLHNVVVDAMKNRTSKLFKEYRPSYGFFLVKRSGEDSFIRVHQDMTLVDETRYRGITVWCPLTDTTVNNGCFHIVRKSHQFIQNIRGANDLLMPYNDIKGHIEREYVEPIELKAGEAIIFDHRLWHYTPSNNTGVERPVIACILLPQEAELYHYKREQDRSISKYRVPRDFPLRYEVGKPLPKECERVEERIAQTPEMDRRTFDRVYRKWNGARRAKPRLIGRIWNRIKSAAP